MNLNFFTFQPPNLKSYLRPLNKCEITIIRPYILVFLSTPSTFPTRVYLIWGPCRTEQIGGINTLLTPIRNHGEAEGLTWCQSPNAENKSKSPTKPLKETC